MKPTCSPARRWSATTGSRPCAASSCAAAASNGAQLPETTPVISAFEYVSGIIHKMFAANATKIYDVTTSTPVAGRGGADQRQLRRLAAGQRAAISVRQRRRRSVARIDGHMDARDDHAAGWVNSTPMHRRPGDGYRPLLLGAPRIPAPPPARSSRPHRNPTYWTWMASDACWIIGPSDAGRERRQPCLRLQIPQPLFLHREAFDERLVPAAQRGRRHAGR